MDAGYLIMNYELFDERTLVFNYELGIMNYLKYGRWHLIMNYELFDERTLVKNRFK
jgi:hypothetical protein